jgi:hypothetical protein
MHRRRHLSRRIALAAVASLPLGVAARPRAVAALLPQRQAEALIRGTFINPSGVTRRLGDLTRPLLLVNLWSAWCPGCLEELPSIRMMAASLGPDAIDVVLLSHAMNWHADHDYLRKAALPFRHWRFAPEVTDSLVAAAFRIEADRFALPQTVVFAGRDRSLVWSSEGSQDWTDPDQLRLVRAWLAVAR